MVIRLVIISALCMSQQIFSAQTLHSASRNTVPTDQEKIMKLERAVVGLSRKMDNLQEQQRVQARFSTDNAQALVNLQRASLSNNEKIQQLQRSNEQLVRELVSLLQEVDANIQELQFDVDALKRVIQGQRGQGMRRSRAFADDLQRVHQGHQSGGWFFPEES